MFAAEFDVAPGRLGRIGAGVTIGSLAGSVGRFPDLAIVLGAADGLMPSAPMTDPLVGDGRPSRRRSGVVRLGRSRDAPGELLGTVRIRPTSDRDDSTGRPADGDQTTAVARLAGALGEVHDGTVASYASGLLASAFPAHAGEHRLRRHSAEVLTSGPEWLASLSRQKATRCSPAA